MSIWACLLPSHYNIPMSTTRFDPILIGPVGAGKTSISAILSKALDVPHVEYDAHRLAYFQELGFDMDVNLALHAREGWPTMYRYWKVFSPYAIERLLAEHTGVLDLGGGAVVCEHIEVLHRLRAAFAPFPNVVLLRPYPDLEQSLTLLNERTQAGEDLQRNNRAFLSHPSFEELAKITVHTQTRTPEEVTAEVLQRLVRA